MTFYTHNKPGAPVGRYSAGDTVVDSLFSMWKCVVPGPEARFAAMGPSARVISGATALTAADSGGVFMLTALTGAAVSLPTMQRGLEYTFINALAPTSNGYVITPADADKIIGRIAVTADEVGDTEDTAGGDTVTFVANSSLAGDWVKLVCDGSNWYVTGIARLAASVLIAG